MNPDIEVPSTVAKGPWRRASRSEVADLDR